MSEQPVTDLPATIDYARYELEFDADFSGPDLDPAQWLPHYLPQWSSREQTRARYDVGDGLLTLRVDADQPPWSVEYDGSVRVSNLQTGVRSGPVGSGSGQHPFRDGLVVREQQSEQWFYTPHYGIVEIRAAATDDPHSMVALWLIGVEDEPEPLGRDLRHGDLRPRAHGCRGLVGMGVHPFNDPAITDDFDRVRVEGDLTRLPRLRRGVDAGAASASSSTVGSCARRPSAPDYPLQLMLDIFHFPPSEGAAGRYPKEFQVQRVRGFRPR